MNREAERQAVWTGRQRDRRQGQGGSVDTGRETVDALRQGNRRDKIRVKVTGNTDGGEDRRETFRRDRDRLRERHRDTYVETAGRKGTQRLT